MRKLLLSASILSADFSNLADQIHQAEDAGVDWIHIDVMDGHFVPNITMGPFIVETCRKITKLPLDAHLMIENPDLFTEAFAKAGADRISIHLEENPNILRSLQRIRDLGCKNGLVINPGTQITSADPLLPFIDLLLVMSVNPGYSGQEFIPEVESKIKHARKCIDDDELPVLIQVDGGVTSKNLPSLVHAGIDVAVAASAIFRHPGGIAKGVSDLLQAIK
jgi:ribulose-phosphate 3-epimerase